MQRRRAAGILRRPAFGIWLIIHRKFRKFRYHASDEYIYIYAKRITKVNPLINIRPQCGRCTRAIPIARRAGCNNRLAVSHCPYPAAFETSGNEHFQVIRSIARTRSRIKCCSYGERDVILSLFNQYLLFP